ncbi:MAG: aminomethyltransferase beta-barrel domain-containing protein, partial [Bdellovibrionota bacterium]
WLTCNELSWISSDFKLQAPMSVQAKIRYRQADQDCIITPLFGDEGQEVRVDFQIPQRAITPRQAVVFYQGTKCLGGGFIREVGPSLYCATP